MTEKQRTQLSELLADIEDRFSDAFLVDARKALEKGNKAAARRSRTCSSKLTKLFKEWRKLTLEAGL